MFDLHNEMDNSPTFEPFRGVPTTALEAGLSAIPRGGLRLAQTAAIIAGSLNPIREMDETFYERQQMTPDERARQMPIPTAEDFFRFADERLQPLIDKLTPDPESLTTAGQITSALFELPLQLVTGGTGIGLNASIQGGKGLLDQGVDATTATIEGIGAGVTMGGMLAMPAAGNTLKQTIPLILANPVLGAGQDALTKQLLESRGYDDQAAYFDPFDPTTRSVDLILGAVFGGMEQLARWRSKAPQQVIDSIDVVDVKNQKDELSPFESGDRKTQKAHSSAMDKATQDLAEGKPVDVSEQLREVNSQVEAEPSYTADLFRSDMQKVFGITENQADATLALIAARAKVLGQSVDEFISRNIAGIQEGLPQNAEMLFQDRSIVQPFFSKVLAEVEGLQQDKWSGDQLLGKLKKTPGVKGEELVWTGLDEFLAGNKKVTREQVRDFLQENQVRIDEVSPERTRYQSYVLPGGENYRELLLTLPGRDSGFTPEKLEIKRISESHTQSYVDLIYDGQSLGRFDDSGGHGQLYKDQELINYARRLFNGEYEALGYEGRDTANFRSGHFDEKNILAHMRFNERTGENGERILHVEEIQSDWHQAGRSKGYQSEGGSVPDAPFKKNWQELALRRLLRWAAENGFDRLTLTTGEQQAARYDLSKQLKTVRYDFENGQYRITGQGVDGEIKSFGSFPEGNLEDALGKDLAGKMIESRKSGKNYQLFEGQDLKIGGEGMRGFYDKILTSYLDKFGKKFGTRVSDIELSDAGRVHTLKITDAMRDSLLYEGTPLFQGEKGAVSFLADGRAMIHALESPDFSTLVHEVGHIFRKTLPKGEQNQIDQWLLSKVPGSKWERADEELFARTFERYLVEGMAPSKEMQGVFDKFKTWLLEVYKRISGTAIDVNLSPQVKTVFDRMLFSEKLKKSVSDDVRVARENMKTVGDEMQQDLRELAEVAEDVDPGSVFIDALMARSTNDAVYGFLNSPENVSRSLADLLETEAAALEVSKAENMVADGHVLEAMISDAADWYLQKNREMSGSGSAMKKASVVNALRKAARGDFARLTAGQQEMVIAALESIADQAQAMAREIDVQDLKIGDRFATPDLGQRVVVGERDGTLYLDNRQSLDLGDTVKIIGEVERPQGEQSGYDSPADFYLKEQGDFEVYSGADSEGNPLKRSAREYINEARADLAKAEAQEHLYNRAALCLNLG